MVSVALAIIQLIGSFILPSHKEDGEVDEGRPLLPQETADEGESMSIRELFVSKDTAVRRGCEFSLYLSPTSLTVGRKLI